MVSNCPWCHIVRGVKLSVFAYGVKLSWFQIFRCQIVCGVKFSYRKGEKTSQFFHFNNNFQFRKFAKVYFCEVFLKCILGFTSLLFSVAKHVVVDIQMTPSETWNFIFSVLSVKRFLNVKADIIRQGTTDDGAHLMLPTQCNIQCSTQSIPVQWVSV